MGQWMPYNFVVNSFHTKFVADLLQAKCDFSWKMVVLHFWAPSGGGLRATYDVHLKLIGKCVVDFLLVLIELFSLGATAEVLGANINWKSAHSLQHGQLDLKFQVEWVATHQPFSSQKTRRSSFFLLNTSTLSAIEDSDNRALYNFPVSSSSSSYYYY